MNYSLKNNIFLGLACTLILANLVLSSPGMAQSTSRGASTTATPADPTPPTGVAPPPTPAPEKSASKTKSSGTPSAQEIAAAKASGKVWVNTETGMYHKSGRWYGKTKTGKFMTESDAKAAGYKEAHR
jgi:hypothetical protein